MPYGRYSDQESTSCCSKASAELKLYQAFIFSVPIFFTFILLFFFYLFYLRRRRIDWSSLRMRTSSQTTDEISRSELGLKKELREMLPIIVFNESFSVKDTQCSVCLGDYQAEDKLQQIPACGHTFHMDCIDHWLANHTTCPLCRLSLLPSAKASTESPDTQTDETIHRSSHAENGDETSLQSASQPREEQQLRQQYLESVNREERFLETDSGGQDRDSHEVDTHRELSDTHRELSNARNEAEGYESGGVTV